MTPIDFQRINDDEFEITLGVVRDPLVLGPGADNELQLSGLPSTPISPDSFAVRGADGTVRTPTSVELTDVGILVVIVTGNPAGVARLYTAQTIPELEAATSRQCGGWAVVIPA